jgi:hypothetical protein
MSSDAPRIGWTSRIPCPLIDGRPSHTSDPENRITPFWPMVSAPPDQRVLLHPSIPCWTVVEPDS